jgi:hypothetical protein
MRYLEQRIIIISMKTHGYSAEKANIRNQNIINQYKKLL